MEIYQRAKTSGLLSSLGIKIPSSKIPLAGPLLNKLI